jgi:hypothetical protein
MSCRAPHQVEHRADRPLPVAEHRHQGGTIAPWPGGWPIAGWPRAWFAGPRGPVEAAVGRDHEGGPSHAEHLHRDQGALGRLLSATGRRRRGGAVGGGQAVPQVVGFAPEHVAAGVGDEQELPVGGLDGMETADGQPGHATDRGVAAAQDHAQGGGGLGPESVGRRGEPRRVTECPPRRSAPEHRAHHSTTRTMMTSSSVKR